MARYQNRILPMEGDASRSRGNHRWIAWLLLALAAVVVAAWVDGGEEPLRPIVETVSAPEQGH